MPPTKDITGQRFTRLTVIKATNKRDRQGNVLFLCRCDCGNEILTRSYSLTSGITKSCGCYKREKVIERNSRRRRNNHPNWNGGRRKNGEYVRILKPEHPYADHMGYVYEHRLVMEKKLGRYLQPEEVVHHIDGNPQNNSPGNLGLFPDQKTHMADHAVNGCGCIGARKA